MTGDSPWTWYQHAAVAVLAPPLLTLPLGSAPRDVALLSAMVLLAFWVRERRDKIKKVREGTWTEKWRRDRAGDLLGPVAATACYLIAWSLT